MARNKTKALFNLVEAPARTKLSDSIISQIEKLILDGALKPGNKLPPEREFAELLGVSRPSLREALLKLEARGLISTRRGGGYAVADVTAPTLTDPLVHLLQQHPPAAYDILELRHGLEEIAAYLAATRANEEDRIEIKRRYTALVKADKGKGDALKGADADLEFHMAVADASHNVALMHVMRGLMNLIRTSSLRFRERIFSGQGGRNVLNGQHRAIYQAVMKGDAQAARETVHLHLSFIEATLRETDHGNGAISTRSSLSAPFKSRRSTSSASDR